MFESIATTWLDCNDELNIVLRATGIDLADGTFHSVLPLSLSRDQFAAMAVVAVVAGCAHHEGPTFAGADLYARVQTLQDKGRVTVPASPHPVEVWTEQILVSVDGGSQYEIGPIIARCRGGDPDHDDECMLAQLRGQRFRVTKAVPAGKPPHVDDDGKMSFRAKALIAALVIGAPLTYGLASCGFAGCHALFGVPLALDAGFLTLATLGPD